MKRRFVLEVKGAKNMTLILIRSMNNSFQNLANLKREHLKLIEINKKVLFIKEDSFNTLIERRQNEKTQKETAHEYYHE